MSYWNYRVIRKRYPDSDAIPYQIHEVYYSASIVIGVILATVAVFLAYESKGLLVGEGADPKTVESIRALAEADPE